MQSGQEEQETVLPSCALLISFLLLSSNFLPLFLLDRQDLCLNEIDPLYMSTSEWVLNLTCLCLQ